MPTITLKQNARSAADINLMTAQPMNVNLTDLAGGPAQFTCTNAQQTIQAATSVDVTYNAGHTPSHQNIQVSSVIT